MKKLVQRLGWPGTIALAVVVLFFAVAILAPWIAPYPAQGAGAPNVAAKLSPPSADYWLGTDHLGRDILSRIIYATRISLTNGVLIVAFSLLIGLPVSARCQPPSPMNSTSRLLRRKPMRTARRC